MNFVELFETKTITIALVFTRYAAFVAVSPFPGNHAPVSQRAGLAVVLAMVTGLALPNAGVPRAFDASVIMGGFGEIACGLIIGMVFRLALAVGDVLGSVAAQGIGLSTPSVLNPTTEQQETPVSKVVSLIALSVVLAAGAHREVLAILMRSFEVFPVGMGFHAERTSLALVNLASGAMAQGVRLGLPALAVSLILQTALALVARAAPQLQIFNVGFTVMVAGGMLAFMGSLDGVVMKLGESAHMIGPNVERILEMAR